MRGRDERTGCLFSYVDLEDRVPAKHPLRVIRRIVNDVLAALDGEFAKIYADSGRPSIPPERLCKVDGGAGLGSRLDAQAEGTRGEMMSQQADGIRSRHSCGPSRDDVAAG